MKLTATLKRGLRKGQTLTILYGSNAYHAYSCKVQNVKEFVAIKPVTKAIEAVGFRYLALDNGKNEKGVQKLSWVIRSSITINEEKEASVASKEIPEDGYVVIGINEYIDETSDSLEKIMDLAKKQAEDSDNGDVICVYKLVAKFTAEETITVTKKEFNF